MLLPQNVSEIYLFDFRVQEFFEGAVDGNNFQRYLHLQGSTLLSSQPSLSGASCDSFDVDRSSTNEGTLPNPNVRLYPFLYCMKSVYIYSWNQILDYLLNIYLVYAFRRYTLCKNGLGIICIKNKVEVKLEAQSFVYYILIAIDTLIS